MPAVTHDISPGQAYDVPTVFYRQRPLKKTRLTLTGLTRWVLSIGGGFSQEPGPKRGAGEVVWGELNFVDCVSGRLLSFSIIVDGFVELSECGRLIHALELGLSSIPSFKNPRRDSRHVLPVFGPRVNMSKLI